VDISTTETATGREHRSVIQSVETPYDALRRGDTEQSLLDRLNAAPSETLAVYPLPIATPSEAAVTGGDADGQAAGPSSTIPSTITEPGPLGDGVPLDDMVPVAVIHPHSAADSLVQIASTFETIPGN